MSFFLKVLTEKGLQRLLQLHRNDIALITAVKEELFRRGLKPDIPKPSERRLDGYERDQ